MKLRNFLGGGSAQGVAAVTGALSAPTLLLCVRKVAVADGEVPVGIFFSLINAVAVAEHTLQDESLLAIEEINPSGGVQRRTLRQIIEDPPSDPATYEDRARLLIFRDKHLTVFGCYAISAEVATSLFTSAFCFMCHAGPENEWFVEA